MLHVEQQLPFRPELKQERPKVQNFFTFSKSKIGEGSYGHVYLAVPKREKDDDNSRKYPDAVYAIKTVKMEGPTAYREMMYLRELKHENIIHLKETYYGDDRKAWLVMEYAEFDLFKIVQFHRRCKEKNERISNRQGITKGIMFQLLNGMDYLHKNLVMHRDLKPANILVMGDGTRLSRGRVKIADFGFARSLEDPLKPLLEADSVVVTCWYRSPELLLGIKHYGCFVDVWSIGCIFVELLTSKPIFFTQNDEIYSKSPYNYYQLLSIYQVMGSSPDWNLMHQLPFYKSFAKHMIKDPKMSEIKMTSLVDHMLRFSKYISGDDSSNGKQRQYELVLDLVSQLLCTDPSKRMTCSAALEHEYFKTAPCHTKDIFNKAPIPYPTRKADVDERENNRPVKTTNPMPSFPKNNQVVSSKECQETQSVIVLKTPSQPVITGNVHEFFQLPQKTEAPAEPKASIALTVSQAQLPASGSNAYVEPRPVEQQPAIGIHQYVPWTSPKPHPSEGLPATNCQSSNRYTMTSFGVGVPPLRPGGVTSSGFALEPTSTRRRIPRDQALPAAGRDHSRRASTSTMNRKRTSEQQIDMNRTLNVPLPHKRKFSQCQQMNQHTMVGFNPRYPLVMQPQLPGNYAPLGVMLPPASNGRRRMSDQSLHHTMPIVPPPLMGINVPQPMHYFYSQQFNTFPQQQPQAFQHWGAPMPQQQTGQENRQPPNVASDPHRLYDSYGLWYRTS